MTAKQTRFFGTKRQRAALRGPRRRRKNVSVRRSSKRGAYSGPLGKLAKYTHKFHGRATRRRKKARKKNVGSILVASIPGFTGLNPGRKRRKTVARHRRRRKANAAPRRRRRRHYSARRRRNPGRRHSARVVVKYRTRGRRHHRRGRRRNPGGFGLGNDATVVAGIITGAAVTRIVTGFVPPSLQAGVPGYVVTAIAAVLQGQLVGKALKKPQFGKYMTWGGLTFLGLKVINDFMPSLSGYIPFGLSGLGLLSPSQGFMLPSVNRMGSMGSFMAPGIVTSAIAAAAPKGGGMHGLTPLNTSARRTGRIQ
jgi:hypothetical protein